MSDCERTLKFVIGNNHYGGLHEVEIWLDDLLLTPFDNMVYLPQFISSMKFELEQLQKRKINPDAFFLYLGPTTDDCSSRIRLEGDVAEVTFELEEGIIHHLSIKIDALISVYQNTIEKLSTLNSTTEQINPGSNKWNSAIN